MVVNWRCHDFARMQPSRRSGLYRSAARVAAHGQEPRTTFRRVTCVRSRVNSPAILTSRAALRHGTTATKFLYLGLPLEKVIERATAAPARVIGRPELGALKVGSPADLAVFSVRSELVRLWDTHLNERRWDRRVRVEATVRGGVVYRPGEL